MIINNMLKQWTQSFHLSEMIPSIESSKIFMNLIAYIFYYKPTLRRKGKKSGQVRAIKLVKKVQ
jgi:hypothetical protein